MTDMQLLRDILLTAAMVAAGIFFIRRGANPSENNGPLWNDHDSRSDDCDRDGGDSCN